MSISRAIKKPNKEEKNLRDGQMNIRIRRKIPIGNSLRIRTRGRASTKTGSTGILHSNFNLNLLIVYPNIMCSTKKIYQKN